MRYPADSRLVLGGGSGGAWPATGGQAGGGAILVWATAIRGRGSWLASGAAGGTMSLSSTGYSGGGAGGSVVLSSAGDLECGLAEASGGRGGLTGSSGQGPGGGGGGGQILLRATGTVACPASAVAGVAGYALGGATPSATTDPRHVGEVTVLAPGVTPGDVPLDGGSPQIVSQPNTSAYCGAPYRYSSRLAPRLVGGDVIAYRIEAGSGELPAGLGLDPETGEFLWVPRPEDTGAHELVLIASTTNGEVRQSFTVVVECLQRGLDVGCRCDAAPGVAALAGLAWFCRRRRGRGRQALPASVD